MQSNTTFNADALRRPGAARLTWRKAPVNFALAGTKMRFEREGCKAIARPSQARIKEELAQTKSSFASLTAADGSYLQFAGGPGLFALEFRDEAARHFRGRQQAPVVRFEDGTILTFSGGSLAMQRHEWFLIDQVVEIAAAFCLGVELPLVEWKPLNDQFTYAS